MLVLALDTTTRQGSAALVRDRGLVGVHVGDAGRTHAERLPGDLVALLERHGLRLRDVDLFAVAAGPGSFTGLRVGIAAIQGLAYAAGRRVVPVSVLEVLSQLAAGWDGFDLREPEPPGTVIGALMDAQRREVFSALSRVRASAGQPARTVAPPPLRLEYLEASAAAPPGPVLERWRCTAHGARLILAGDGAIRYRAVIEEVMGQGVHVLEPLPPVAPVLGALAERLAETGGAVAPHAVRPIYVRRPDAELARERGDAARAGSDAYGAGSR
jgi:tRNA threonylcarbamoyladenosine biosynthesis protein TsaB